MGLLTKVYEIIWANPYNYSGIIPCGGRMHLLMSVFPAIGWPQPVPSAYEDTGLKQLLSESGVYVCTWQCTTEVDWKQL